MMGANYFIQAFDLFDKVSYVAAFSATPNRNDSKHDLYYNYFESMIYMEILDNYDL
jgi:hypothetical protein